MELELSYVFLLHVRAQASMANFAERGGTLSATTSAEVRSTIFANDLIVGKHVSVTALG